MNIHPKIPVPITFNPHKHHFGFLKNQIILWREMKWQNVEKEMQAIGTNLLDLYLGELPVEKICNEVNNFFTNKEIWDYTKFIRWLKPMNYQKLELSDHSVWILKEGVDHQRYIHIHPAKNSPNSIRVRGTTLKTALALKIIETSLHSPEISDLKKVNYIRQKYLQLSPVKSLQSGKGISRIWSYFNSS